MAEIIKASKLEASSLPSKAESYLTSVRSKIADIEDKENAGSCYDNDISISDKESGNC